MVEEPESPDIPDQSEAPDQSPSNQPAAKSGWLSRTTDRLKAGRQQASRLDLGKIDRAREIIADPRQAAQDAAVSAVKKKVAAKAAEKLAAKIGSRFIPYVGQVLLALDVLKLALKHWLPLILLGLAGLLIVPLIIFAILSFLFGWLRLPETTAEKATVAEVVGASGEASSIRLVTLDRSKEIKNQLTKLKAKATKIYDRNRANQFVRQSDAFIAKLDTLPTVFGPLKQKLLTELNDLFAALGRDYPELGLIASNCADLKPYLDSGQLSLKRGPEKAMLPKGLLLRGGHSSAPQAQRIAANANLCRILGYLLSQGHKLAGVTLAYGHRKCSQSKTGSSLDGDCAKVSQHYNGEGVDIAMIDGQTIGSSGWLETTRAVQADLQAKRKSLGVYQLYGPNRLFLSRCQPTSSAGAKIISDHRDHLHIGALAERHLSLEGCKS